MCAVKKHFERPPEFAKFTSVVVTVYIESWVLLIRDAMIKASLFRMMN